MELLSQFEQYLMMEKKASPNTVAAYKRDMTQFLHYLNSKGMDAMQRCSCQQIEGFFSYLESLGRSPSSLARIHASLKAYYSFLCHQNYLTGNPAAALKNVKREKRYPQILTPDEVECLLQQPSGGDSKGIRDHAMLEVLYATGMRVSELLSLNVEDVFLEAGLIRCRNGEKVRMIPLYDVAIKVLSQYLHHIRGELIQSTEEQALFVNRNGQRMSRQGFWGIIKQYGQQAGIKKDITPHTLRHSFGAHLLQNGANLAVMQEMMGHADRSSTRLYVQMIKRETKMVYQNTHPRAAYK